MIIENSKMVTLENGPRPAGKPDECFYCHEKVGQQHKPECVCFKKIIKVIIQVEYLRTVPAHWDANDIEFSMNESSSCKSNLIEEIHQVYGHDNNKRGFNICPCSHADAKYIRDATSEDMEMLPLTTRFK